MTDHIQFLLLGLGNGAVYAALALALVLTYRSSGVVNFGTSAIALVTAYVYAGLRNDGDLLVIVPGLPDRVDLGGPMPFVVATLVAMAFGALLGLVLYVAVFRPLRNSPQVASAVASLGVMLVLQEMVNFKFGSDAIRVDSIFPEGKFELGSVSVPQDRVWLVATVLAITAGIVIAGKSTRFGLATRAVAETETGAVISGLSPTRIAALNWMISSMVAGLSGILIAPIVPLAPVSYTLFIVPALAAALVGGLTAAVPAVVGALLLGMLQSYSVYLTATTSWAPNNGFPELIALGMVVLVMLVRGKPLPPRGAIIKNTLGHAPRPRALGRNAAGWSIVGAATLVFTDGSWRGAVINSMVMGIVGLSFVVVTGFAGQISLAQLTIAGASGFLLSGLTDGLGIPFPVAPLLAASGAALIGVLFGLPALRVRGLNVAVVTLALAVAIDGFWFRNNSLNGGVGGAEVEGPSLFGIDLAVGSGTSYPRLQFGFVCLVALVAAATGVASLRRSRLGSAMLAVRANERAAAAAGVDVVRVKLLAFTVGAFLAGIGGAMLAYHRTVVTVESYGIFAGLALFGTVYLAGITSVSGGVVAGVMAVGGLSWLVFERWLDFGEWYGLTTALLLVITVIGNPEGVVGHAHLALARRHQKPADPPRGRAATLPQHDPVVAVDTAAVAMQLRDVTVRYGGMKAVDGVSFNVPRGRIVGLIGPNGAGKTSLIDAIGGFAPTSGGIELNGVDITRLRPHDRVAAGLSRTFQSVELYDDLSVAENIAVGHHARRTAGGGTRSVDDVLRMLGIDHLRDQPASDLSHGQRQFVSICRALVANPDVLLLDEPASGLDDNETIWLRGHLQGLRASGVAMLLVDHDMSLVLAVCDHVVVLDFGRVIAEGPPAQIQSDARVMQAYLGGSVAVPDVAGASS